MIAGFPLRAFAGTQRAAIVADGAGGTGRISRAHWAKGGGRPPVATRDLESAVVVSLRRSAGGDPS